jgi:MoxR-like ATPase
MYYTRECHDISRAETPVSGQVDDHPGDYQPDDGLVDAVNVALTLNRPLLLTGDPGTGKTQLAFSVAWQLFGRKRLKVSSPRVERFEAKSTSVARDLFYSFDALARFQAASTNGSTNNRDYITYNGLGRALLRAMPRKSVEELLPADFTHDGPTRSVVLIDEIDKAPRDFPNSTRCSSRSPNWAIYAWGAPSPCRRNSSRWSSSPATRKRTCRIRSCAAACTTTSHFRVARSCTASSRPGSRN